MFDAYANAGGNFIDTANRYTEGTSEKYVGEFVKADREHFVVATKYTLFTERDDPRSPGLQIVRDRHGDVEADRSWEYRVDARFVLPKEGVSKRNS